MYNEKKKNNALLGFLGALLLILPLVLGVVFGDTIKGWFERPDDVPTEEVTPEVDGDVMTEIQDSDMLKLTKRNKISVDGQALSVSATLSPDYAYDKKVSWSVAWKGTNTANVLDYVSITPSTDTLTCSVSVKKAFTQQIILTCSATSDSSVKATCTIDYVGRNLSSTGMKTNFSGKDVYSMTNGEVFNYLISGATFTSEGGSLVGEIKNVSFQGFELGGAIFYTSSDLNANFMEELMECFDDEQYSVQEGVDRITSDGVMHIIVKYDVYYNDVCIKTGLTDSIYYGFDYGDSLRYSPTDITLNDTQLIF